MKVKIKKLHSDAVIPTYAKSGDAGMDLVATSMKFDGTQITYGTGLAMEIPEGFVGLVFAIKKNFFPSGEIWILSFTISPVLVIEVIVILIWPDPSYFDVQNSLALSPAFEKTKMPRFWILVDVFCAIDSFLQLRLNTNNENEKSSNKTELLKSVFMRFNFKLYNLFIYKFSNIVSLFYFFWIVGLVLLRRLPSY